ncbi:MAG: TonB-dependent receptor [Caulobacteraceae bacterium]
MVRAHGEQQGRLFLLRGRLRQRRLHFLRNIPQRARRLPGSEPAVHRQRQYTKQSHEFRVSSPGDQPVRFLGGLFYERQTDLTTSNYIIPGLAASGALNPAGTDPAAVPTAGDDIFYKHLNRVDRDFALFGELAWDIRPNLTLTLGGRYFTADNTLLGFSGFSTNALDPTTCFASTAITQVPCVNVNARVKEDGETHKVNLSWKIQPQVMVYATYSTGFRPGGINRPVRGVDEPPYQPDTVDNYELGWKTTWLDGTLRFNGAIFDEEWHGVQYALSPPGAAGVTIIDNAGDARSYGLEGDVAWRPLQGLTLTASGTVLHAALTQTFCNFDSSGAPTGVRAQGHPAAGAAELQGQRQRPLRIPGARLQELHRRRPSGAGPVHLGPVHRRRSRAWADRPVRDLRPLGRIRQGQLDLLGLRAEPVRRPRRAQQGHRLRRRHLRRRPARLPDQAPLRRREDQRQVRLGPLTPVVPEGGVAAYPGPLTGLILHCGRSRTSPLRGSPG